MLEVVIVFIGFLLKIVRIFLLPILKIVYRRQRKRLPPIKNDLLQIPAVDLANKIRMKQVQDC